MLITVNLSSHHLDFFQGFLNLSKESIRTGNIPKVKAKKLRFLQEFIVPNRALFRSSGTQLCTTYIGKELDANPQTVMNWIKTLIKKRMLSVQDKTWVKGMRSRSYIVNEENEALVEILNAYNGFNSQNKTNAGQRKKFQMRDKAWARFNYMTPKPKDIMRLAGSYIGCPKQLADDLKRNIPKHFLLAPSLMNAHQPLVYEFFRCLKIATKNVNQMSLENDDIPREYSYINSYFDFCFKYFYEAWKPEMYDHNLQVLRDLYYLKSKTEHPIRKKRLEEYYKGYQWALDYEANEEYEEIEGYAPYHSWEKLV